MVISQNIVIVNFLFILVTFQSGIWGFLTSIHCCPEAHWSVQTKQRENLWTAIPAVNSSRWFNKIRVNDCVSRNGCRINTTEPNQMILVSIFSEDNVLSDEIKICYIFEYQSNENRAFRFFGTPGIFLKRWKSVYLFIFFFTIFFHTLGYLSNMDSAFPLNSLCAIFWTPYMFCATTYETCFQQNNLFLYYAVDSLSQTVLVSPKDIYKHLRVKFWRRQKKFASDWRSWSEKKTPLIFLTLSLSLSLSSLM